jgi:hypothetical protein
MEPFYHTITFNNKKYNYSIKPINKKMVHFKCEAANIDQEFLAEDIPALLTDLRNLIIAEKLYQESEKKVIRFRISPEEKKEIEKRAAKAGFSNVSAFIRHLALNN